MFCQRGPWRFPFHAIAYIPSPVPFGQLSSTSKESNMKATIRFSLMTVLVGLSLPLQAASTLQFVTSSSTVPDWAPNTAVPDYTSPARLAVQRTNDLNTEVSVDYATVDGTATAGLKYMATHGTLVFAAGETNQTIVVPILNEGLVDGDQTFQVILSNPTNAVLGARTTQTVSIFNVDVGLQFQFANYNAANGWPLAEGVGTVLIGVVRGDDANLPVTVDFATSDGTALSGRDYVGLTNTLSFEAQERLKFVPITLLNDSLKEEATQTFKATLSNPIRVSLGATKTTTVTILDNDQGFQFETNRYDVAEDAGAALVGVLRGTDDINSTVTVDLTSTDNSALNGQDYVGLTNNVTFAPGEWRKVVPTPILNDGIKESLESFKLTLSNPTGSAVLGSPATASVYIRDNDPGVGFEFTGYTNAWDQAGDFSVTVLRGNDGILGPIAVDYATSDLTAKVGEDYQAVSGTLTFQENEMIKRLIIPLLRPRAVPRTNSFRVKLSNATGGAALGTSTTTVSIQGIHATVAPPFDTALTIRREWGVNILSWTGGGTLQRADDLTGPWQTLTNATSPYTVESPVPTTFYRVTRPRLVNVYVPASYTGQTNLPLLIVLHGYGGIGVFFETNMRFNREAEARGFLVCYPDGTPDRKGRQYWNATDSNDWWNDRVDDTGYLRALIQEIGSRLAVDPKRVYLIGMSTGGDMVGTMACHSADLIAGIANMAGNTYLNASDCHPSEPVNILCMCGTADEWNSYYGRGEGAVPDGITPPFPGAVRSALIWAGYNGASDPVTDPAPTLDLVLKASPSGSNLPGADTVVTRYLNYPAGGAIELWSIIGATHTLIVYDATHETEFYPRLLDWFFAHPKP